MTVELTKSFLNDCSLATLPCGRCEPLAKRVNSRPLPRPTVPSLRHYGSAIVQNLALYWVNKQTLAAPNISPSKIVLGSLFQETLETCRNIVPPATKLLQTFAIPRHNNDNKIGHYKVGNWFGAKFVRFRHLSRPFLAICDCIFQNIGE